MFWNKNEAIIYNTTHKQIFNGYWYIFIIYSRCLFIKPFIMWSVFYRFLVHSLCFNTTNMSKVNKASQYANQYSNVFKKYWVILFCNFCGINVSRNLKFQVDQRVETLKHMETWNWKKKNTQPIFVFFLLFVYFLIRKMSVQKKKKLASRECYVVTKKSVIRQKKSHCR